MHQTADVHTIAVQSAIAVCRSKKNTPETKTKTHHVMLAESILIHLQDLPRGYVEALDGVLGKHRLLANELLSQAMLPGLPSARHDQTPRVINLRVLR